MGTPRKLHAQLSTEDHLADPGFWPTQTASSRQEFIGPAGCQSCHAEKVASQSANPMGRTLVLAADSKALAAHPRLTFTVAQYRYLIESGPGHSMYTVTDGKETLSWPLRWAFGTPRVGQSYLFQKDNGHYYEARVTYFPSLQALGFTPSRDLPHPKNIDEAMYREVPASEIGRCFSCHATASNIADTFNEATLIPGVTCEACHGSGAHHAADMKQVMAGKQPPSQTSIFNSAHLSPTDQVEFCGACHGTWWDVKLSGTKGVSTTRSAPYRLVTSKCWGGKGDVRLVCTACHDPHRQLQTEAADYDHACLKCHVNAAGASLTADHPGKACPKASKNCTSCHMPKEYVPEMHDNFTDHRIRIARTGEPFPE
jgi:nitrate/TMAO reductase-like tetraheme cytochrome c subunit